MHYSRIKQLLAIAIQETSWEQVLFSLSQLAIDEEIKLEEAEDSDQVAKFSKLASDLHDLSNLVG